MRNNIYQRTKVLLGEETLKKLAEKRVLLFGLGGVGGACFQTLVRLGIKHFTIVDNDCFSLSNLNRQSLSTLETINKSKVDVAIEFAKQINEEIEVVGKKMFYLPETRNQIDFSSFDIIIDCIDTISAKIDIALRAKEENIKLLSAMGCGNRVDPTKLYFTDLFKTEKDPLAKVMRRELRKRGITSLEVLCSKEETLTPKEKITNEEGRRKDIPGSTPFVPQCAGIFLAYRAYQILIDKN